MALFTVIDTGRASAEENMRIDAALLNDLDPRGPAVLHLYDWQGDCATFGYFIKPEEFLNLEGVQRRGLTLARRPTGGGIVFHVCDYAFSVLIPAEHPCASVNTLANYRTVNQAVIDAVSAFRGGAEIALLPTEPQAADAMSAHFCMAKPTKYDVMIGGRKIGGAAQRRCKQGLLHQGSVAVAALSREYLSEVLLPDTQVLSAMQANTATVLGSPWTIDQVRAARTRLQSELVMALERVFQKSACHL